MKFNSVPTSFRFIYNFPGPTLLESNVSLSTHFLLSLNPMWKHFLNFLSPWPFGFLHPPSRFLPCFHKFPPLNQAIHIFWSPVILIRFLPSLHSPVVSSDSTQSYRTWWAFSTGSPFLTFLSSTQHMQRFFLLPFSTVPYNIIVGITGLSCISTMKTKAVYMPGSWESQVWGMLLWGIPQDAVVL